MEVHWEPITESALWDEINASLERMSVAQRRVWDCVCVVPEKWAQHPYGDAGGGFWVVGTIGCLAIWFNDIEDGFNLSRYRRHGELDEYWCNQDNLEWTLGRIILMLDGKLDLPSASPPMPLTE